MPQGYHPQSDTPFNPPLLEHIYSADRTLRTDDPANCTIVLGREVLNTVAVELESFAVPNTLYNVRSGYNVMTVNFDGGTISVTVPPAQYTSTTFLTALNTAITQSMTAAGYTPPATLTATYSSSGFLVLTLVAGGALNTITDIRYSTSNDLLSITGVDATQNTFGVWVKTVGATSITFPYLPQFSSPSWAFIKVVGWPSGTIASSNSALTDLACTFSVPLTESGGYLTFNSRDVHESPKIKWNHDTQISRLQIIFYNHRGEILSFNGADWVLVMKFHFGACC